MLLPLTQKPESHPRGAILGPSLAALGIVFGDIGTSPLYTFKTILTLTGSKPDAGVIIGSLSLILWTLFIITTIKYVNFAMRVDNGGEGGILALMTLLGVKQHKRPAIIAIGLFGAALIYGDGAITPAISVLSALEGMGQVTPALTPYVVPLAVVILIALFAIQPLGTSRIGRAFGPIMLLWFSVIAALGIAGIVRHPSIFVALNPVYGFKFLISGGVTSFVILGAVFLCVTGAEALYADMGHFGPFPIRVAWNAIVFPSLVLNYAGQAAAVLDGAPAEGNIFFQLCPPKLLTPLIVLATVATIIASQSIITGAFSMTRQAIQLGWMPRLHIKQTSSEGYGQIYVGAVNWLLMLITLGLTVGFGKSDNLAAAYGLAVSLTMLMTSVLLFIAMREIWQWSFWAAGAVAGAFLVVDIAFFTSNMAKFFEGGYVPIAMAVLIYGIMWLWHRGSTAVYDTIQESLMPIDAFLRELNSRNIARVPGSAVFFTRSAEGAPPVMVWHVKLNRSLHEEVLVFRWTILQSPRVADKHRVEVSELGPKLWRADVKCGFMEVLDIPKLLEKCREQGCPINFADVTYYIGHEAIAPREDGKGIPRWQEMIFAAMARNAAHVSADLKLPRDRIVEIGRQFSI